MKKLCLFAIVLSCASCSYGMQVESFFQRILKQSNIGKKYSVSPDVVEQYIPEYTVCNAEQEQSGTKPLILSKIIFYRETPISNECTVARVVSKFDVPNVADMYTIHTYRRKENKQICGGKVAQGTTLFVPKKILAEGYQLELYDDQVELYDDQVEKADGALTGTYVLCKHLQEIMPFSVIRTVSSMYTIAYVISQCYNKNSADIRFAENKTESVNLVETPLYRLKQQADQEESDADNNN